jgi:hypothetical protein
MKNQRVRKEPLGKGVKKYQKNVRYPDIEVARPYVKKAMKAIDTVKKTYEDVRDKVTVKNPVKRKQIKIARRKDLEDKYK